MPNQWAWSAINVSLGTQALNRHQTNGHIELSMFNGHKNVLDQCQTNGFDQLSMSLWTQALIPSMLNQWDQSVININMDTSTWLSMPNQFSHNLQLITQQGHYYSLAVIEVESLYQLIYLRLIWHKLKFKDIITIPLSLFISHD